MQGIPDLLFAECWLYTRMHEMICNSAELLQFSQELPVATDNDISFDTS